MTPLHIVLADETQPKWARPEHFLNLFEWTGLGHWLDVTTTPALEGARRPVYVLNLNNQYRLDRDLAAHKAAGNPCVYDALDKKVWAEVERRDGILVLDSVVEAMVARSDIAEGLMRGIAREQLDPERVFIVDCNLRASALFEERFLSKLARRPHLIDFDSCFWLLSGFNRLTDANRDALSARADRAFASRGKTRPLKYVSFNGRLRPHRFYVVLWLLANGLFEHGRLSFLAYENKATPADMGRLRAMLERTKYPESANAMPYFDQLIERLPMSIDVTLEESQAGAAYKRTMPWRSQSPELYDEASFSIVVDTQFESIDYLFLTPIAFKSFMNFSPFVYFGSHGSLRRMRELGFKTFAPLIDESYDDEVDGHRRMGLALQQLRALCARSPAELAEMQATLWPVLEHNYWHIHRDAPSRAPEVIRRELLAPMGLHLA